MAQKNDCRCFKLRGKLYYRDYYCPESAGDLNTDPWTYLGNSENFSITPNVNTETVPDYTNCAGGTLCKNTQIETIDISFTTTCHSVENLALAFNGESAVVPEGPITGEEHYIADPFTEPCIIIPNECPDFSKPFTVEANGNPLTEGTHFYIEDNVIFLDKDNVGGAYNAGDSVRLDYIAKEQFCIEGLLSASKDLEFRFIGKNCDDGKPIDINIYRACITASDEFTFISDTFNRITFNGVLLQDSSKKGDGASKYYKVAGAV